MRLIPAVSLAVSLARLAGAPTPQVTPACVPPPPPKSGYFGDYGPPLRYVLTLIGRGSARIAPGRFRHRINLLSF